jgi:hypothetical protein
MQENEGLDRNRSSMVSETSTPVNDDRGGQQVPGDPAREGLAIAITLIASGGLCFFAPAYVDAASRSRAIWIFCGAVLTLWGCLLGVVEADRMEGRRVISDHAFAALILILAVATGVLAASGGFGPWIEES